MKNWRLTQAGSQAGSIRALNVGTESLDGCEDLVGKVGIIICAVSRVSQGARLAENCRKDQWTHQS